ncbi:hypothetical protein AK812_SmicGene31839 [Symbiodinium microadriaticum]|uniref:Uncharacterized protein n=1 Tax=Symbiodinium microadriaticum TaxID=2951 RepID=A0A1Q9CVL4_SYMMI|nr:hypothetical protein AK812_SmicGene31839 [Symbiodinium microadriaticum]
MRLNEMAMRGKEAALFVFVKLEGIGELWYPGKLSSVFWRGSLPCVEEEEQEEMVEDRADFHPVFLSVDSLQRLGELCPLLPGDLFLYREVKDEVEDVSIPCEGGLPCVEEEEQEEMVRLEEAFTLFFEDEVKELLAGQDEVELFLFSLNCMEF